MIPKNPYKSKDDRYTIQLGLQKIAWQACKETHIAWLFSPCTEPKHIEHMVLGRDRWEAQGRKHYQCPICMKELEEDK